VTVKCNQTLDCGAGCMCSTRSDNVSLSTCMR
jgi:hypothetical protein